ncbi:MAG: hypothetical protein ACRD26_20315 [Vicinamibacterales bacterium]
MRNPVSAWTGAAPVVAALATGACAGATARTIDVDRRAVLLATIEARCDACAWDVEGREAVTLVLTTDGRYAQHLPLVRGGTARYEVLLGTVDPGPHVVRVAIDREHTARELRSANAASARIAALTAVREDDERYEALSFAPFLYARPNTIGRFTDVPVFMWYEREPTDRGTRYRYSVVFTNEDGGTPTDRLMATWGRTTDIEYVYSVEVDGGGRIVADDIQGPDHKILAFGGRREARHPLLWVSTDNNMLLDTGTTRVRVAPAPAAFPLDGASREAVMDANPWIYAVAARELAREGKIAGDAPPGRNTIPDPRRFAYVEACGHVGGAALSFEVRAGNAWIPSDRGVPAYRIVRDGCVRAAIPLPEPLGPRDLRSLRVIASARPNASGVSATVPVRLDRINTVFVLDERHRPGAPLLRWSGPAAIEVGGPPLEIAIR